MTEPSVAPTRAAKRRERRLRAVSRASLKFERSSLLTMRGSVMKSTGSSDGSLVQFAERQDSRVLTDLKAQLSVELDGKLKEFRKQVLLDVNDLIAEAQIGSLTAFGWKIEERVHQPLSQRLRHLETLLLPSEPLIPAAPGVPAQFLARQCKAVRIIQQNWRNAMGRISKAMFPTVVEASEQNVGKSEVIHSATPGLSLPGSSSRQIQTGVDIMPLGLKEFQEMARLVRNRLPHIRPMEPPMLMICDRADQGKVEKGDHVPSDDNGSQPNEEARQKELEAFENKEQSCPDDTWNEAKEKEKFEKVWEQFAIDFPTASGESLAKACMHVLTNGDEESARAILTDHG